MDHSDQSDHMKHLDYSDRVIHDPVHGTITLTHTAWQIIDTEEFQRLRHIKQNGSVCFVYPGAEHTRFQHSLGVAYLCLVFGEKIQCKYPSLITPHEIGLLCVAGLVHDLGHGPLSHLYDSLVIPAFQRKYGLPESGFSHEEASYRILERICRVYHVGLTEEDLNTIGKMIFGSAEKTPKGVKLDWIHPPEKQFLYEIVSNSRTGIDVDKFDYLRRDSHYCGVTCAFDPQRLMAFFQIVDGHIEYHHKGKELIIAMWRSRDDLHRRVYQHRVVKCIDQMMLHAIVSCGDRLLPTYAGGSSVELKRAHLDLDSYCQLTDMTLECLLKTNATGSMILRRLYCRQLWPTVLTVISSNALKFPSFDRVSSSEILYSVANFDGEYRYHFYLKEKETPPDFYRKIAEDTRGEAIILQTRPVIHNVMPTSPVIQP